ncbi:MAG TPA: tetratricopeptide repeat-containing serine protease family protein [Candidatus Bathyarchaeia archaeon]|nr:tetratricopeptide repeat-containing serine protease family protein [Candidatus Bathyarchaeia archaeon]
MRIRTGHVTSGIIVSGIVAAVLFWGWEYSVSNDIHPESVRQSVRDSVVVVFSTDARSAEIGTGFVLEEQSWVVTAWHNTVRLSEKGAHREPVVLFVASPYYGDVFVGEVVASDPLKDIAVLHVDWPIPHPHLQPAQDTAGLGEEVLAVSYTAPRAGEEVSADKGGPTPDLHVERLRVTKSGADSSIANTSQPWETWHSRTSDITHGWSGCPVLNADYAVEGLLTRLHILQLKEGNPETRPEIYPLGVLMKDIRPLVPLSAGFETNPRVHPTPPNDASEAFRSLVNAIDALLCREMQRAKNEALRFIALRPDSPVAHIVVADILGHASEPELAERNANIARKLAPDNAMVHLCRGKVLMAVGKHGDGLDSLRKAAELQAANLPAMQSLLVALRHNKEYVEAERIGRAAVPLMPENAIVRAELAWVLNETGRRDEAIEAFHEAIRLYPENHQYRRHLGLVLEKAGHYDEAEAHYLQLTTLEPENPVVWYWYTDFLVKNRPGMHRLALRALRKIESLNVATTPAVSPSEVQELRQQIEFSQDQEREDSSRPIKTY